MRDIELRLEDLKTAMMNDEVFKEYLRLKKLMDNNQELIALAAKIREHQKNMTQNMDNDEIYFKEKEIYEDLLKNYESHPLVSNYETVKKEAFEILNNVKDIIE